MLNLCSNDLNLSVSMVVESLPDFTLYYCLFGDVEGISVRN